MIKEDTINIILADCDKEKIKKIMNKLKKQPRLRVIGVANNGDNLIERAKSVKPDAILMDFSLIDITAAGVVKKVKELDVDTHVFVVAESVPEHLKREIMFTGVAGIFEIEEIDKIDVENILRNIKKDKDKDLNTDLNIEDKKIILTYNTKGGVGKSTIAVNLAVALRKSPLLKHKKIALVDFDTAGANISTLCHISDKKVIAKNLFYFSELPEDIKMDDDDIGAMMIENKDGIMILPAPMNYAYSSNIDFRLSNKILKILKNHFDILIIDGSPNTSATVDAALMHATDILLVTNTETQSVKQLMRFVDLLTIKPIKQGDFSYVLDKMYIVVNHTQSNDEWGLKAVDIARTINRPLLREVPYSEYIKEALHGDSGMQAIELDNKGLFATSIRGLANDICGAYPKTLDIQIEKHEKKSKRSFLSNLFSK